MKLHNVKVLGCVLLVLATRAGAEDDDGIDGQRGRLNVSGSMHESPCTLEMTSLHQTVDLGAVSASQLQRPGDQAPSKPFQLRFQDCQRTAGSIRSERTGTGMERSPTGVVGDVCCPCRCRRPTTGQSARHHRDGTAVDRCPGARCTAGLRGRTVVSERGQHDPDVECSTHAYLLAPLTSGAFRAVVDFRLSYE